MNEKGESELVRDQWLSDIGIANSEAQVEEMVLEELDKHPEWDEPFFVGNLKLVLDKYKLWRQELPDIDIFYAVKANDDPMQLQLLSTLGVSFDCASKGEIDAILRLGVPTEKIMYSNPYKLPSHLSYATSVGVRWMVVDSLDELNKIRALCPSAKLVIRIHPRKETTAYLKMSAKFGCNFYEAIELLEESKRVGLSVEGISFYVGHCTESPDPYADAIQLAKDVFVKALSMGHNVHLLDIGGGFQGAKEKEELFVRVAATIRETISQYFPPEMGVRVIGEPGQFMGIRAFDIYAKVIGVRLRQTENGNRCQSVYVTGGHFGCIPNYNFTYNKTKVEIPRSSDSSDKSTRINTTFWGPSCDPMDCLVTVDFPPVQSGRWLRFTNLGAYTRSIMSQYNGFPMAPTKYFFDRESRDLLKDDILERCIP